MEAEPSLKSSSASMRDVMGGHLEDEQCSTSSRSGSEAHDNTPNPISASPLIRNACPSTGAGNILTAMSAVADALCRVVSDLGNFTVGWLFWCGLWGRALVLVDPLDYSCHSGLK